MAAGRPARPPGPPGPSSRAAGRRRRTRTPWCSHAATRATGTLGTKRPSARPRTRRSRVGWPLQPRGRRHGRQFAPPPPAAAELRSVGELSSFAEPSQEAGGCCSERRWQSSRPELRERDLDRGLETTTRRRPRGHGSSLSRAGGATPTEEMLVESHRGDLGKPGLGMGGLVLSARRASAPAFRPCRAGLDSWHQAVEHLLHIEVFHGWKGISREAGLLR